MSKNTTSVTSNPFIIIAGSLSFIVGMAWNNAIQTGIKQHYPIDDKKDNLRAQILYALIVTIIIILIVFLLDYLNRQTALISATVGQRKQSATLSKKYENFSFGF
jgi:TRAP-type C4-dicarboxylate transport system permease small subunit